MKIDLVFKTKILMISFAFAFGCAKGSPVALNSVAPIAAPSAPTPSAVTTHSDVSSVTWTYTDFYETRAADHGTCVLSTDFQSASYTPSDSSFSGTDSCDYYGPYSGNGFTIYVDYADPQNPVAQVFGSIN